MSRRPVSLAVTLLACGARILAAQESQHPDSSGAFTLGEITVQAPADGAAPFEQTVGADRLRLLDRADLAAGLNLLPGVTISSVGPRNESGVFVRGFDLRQVPLLIDGIPVYVPYDGYVDLGRFTTYDAAQIQVARGFSSVLLGPNALGGAINVVSRRPSAPYELESGAGAFTGDGYQTWANVGARRPRWYAQLGGSYLTQDDFRLSSDFAPASGEDGDRRDNAYRTDWRASGKVAFTPTEADEYALSVAVQRGEKGNPPYAGSDPSQSVRYWRWPQWDKTSVYGLSRTALGGSGYLKGRIYYDRFDNQLFSYDDATYTTQTRRSSFQSIYYDDTWGGSAEVGTARFGDHLLKAAAHAKVDAHREHNQGEPVRTSRDRTLSLALEDVHQATDRLAIIAGVSYDDRRSLLAEDFQDGVLSEFPGSANASWNPQIAATYDLRAVGAVRASVARKSRFPTIKDRYSYRLGSALPNPDLISEGAWHAELAYTGAYRGIATFRASAFLSRIDDLIQRVDDVARDEEDLPLFQLQNVGDARHLGFDVGFEARAARWLLGGVSYSWLDRENLTDPDGFLIDTPKAKLLAFAEGYALPWAGVVGSMEWNSSRFTSSSGLAVPGFTLVNLKARLRPASGVAAEIGFLNLFDETYALVEGFPEPGRTFLVTLRYDYAVAGGR